MLFTIPDLATQIKQKLLETEQVEENIDDETVKAGDEFKILQERDFFYF